MDLMRPRGRGPVDGTALEMIETPDPVRGRGLIRGRITQQARLGPELAVFHQDRAVHLIGPGLRMPVDRAVLEMVVAPFPFRVVARQLIRPRIAERAALPAQRRPFGADGTVHLVRAAVGRPVDRTALEMPVVADPVGANLHRRRGRAEQAGGPAQGLMPGVDHRRGQLERVARCQHRLHQHFRKPVGSRDRFHRRHQARVHFARCFHRDSDARLVVMRAQSRGGRGAQSVVQQRGRTHLHSSHRFPFRLRLRSWSRWFALRSPTPQGATSLPKCKSSDH